MKTTAIVTGASSGFGKAIAKEISEDYNLVLLGRRQKRLDELKSELESITEVHTIIQDIRDYKENFKLVDSLPLNFKNIEVLVNNAGLALGLDSAESANWNDWQQMIDTNIVGLTSLTRSILPELIKNSSGHIINIGSIAGAWPYPGGNVYGATKAYVAQFSRNLRADLNGKNIRVTNIEPGLAETEFSVVRFDGDKSKADSVYKNTQPLIAEDIARAAHWVLKQPRHVNINSLEIMPTQQSWGPLAIDRSDPLN
ncbi:MAG: SDR family NAD(P)-dependent oxidoreductase [Bdellovibrionales bacterium]